MKRFIPWFILIVAIAFVSCGDKENVITDQAKEDTEINGVSNQNYIAESDITLDLPEGYYLSEYSDYYGWAGGWLICPKAYEFIGNNPADWVYSGFVGKIRQSAAGFVYEDGKPNGLTVPLQNHTDATIKEVYRQADWWIVEALLVYDMDIVNQSERQGGEEHQVSKYWTFYFTKEEENILYYISLSADVFTEEEAKDIVKSFS